MSHLNQSSTAPKCSNIPKGSLAQASQHFHDFKNIYVLCQVPTILSLSLSLSLSVCHVSLSQMTLSGEHVKSLATVA